MILRWTVQCLKTLTQTLSIERLVARVKLDDVLGEVVVVWGEIGEELHPLNRIIRGPAMDNPGRGPPANIISVVVRERAVRWIGDNFRSAEAKPETAFCPPERRRMNRLLQESLGINKRHTSLSFIEHGVVPLINETTGFAGKKNGIIATTSSAELNGFFLEERMWCCSGEREHSRRRFQVDISSIYSEDSRKCVLILASIPTIFSNLKIENWWFYVFSIYNLP